MAVPNKDTGGFVYSDNNVEGPSDGVAQATYAVSTVQKGAIGSLRRGRNGKSYRYGYFSSAVAQGKLVAPDFSVGGTGYLTAKVTNSAGTQADVAVGAEQVYLLDTDTFTTADREDVYAGGSLHVVNEGGEGFTYDILSNTQGAADGSIRLDIDPPIQVQLDSEDVEVCIMPNDFANLIIASATDTLVCGVTVVDMAAGEYGWVQVAGKATVLADENAGTIHQGGIAQLSDGVSGAVQPFGGGAINSEDDHSYDQEPIVGFFGNPTDDADHVPVYLVLPHSA